MKDLGFSFLSNNSGCSEQEYRTGTDQLQAYRKRLLSVIAAGGYVADEASLNLSDDAALRERVAHKIRDTHTDALKYIIVIGIGGSNLGTKAIYEALVGTYDGLLEERHPKLLFLDTTNPFAFTTIKEIFDAEIVDANEFFINIVSKSGTTTEAMANGGALHAYLHGRFGEVTSRFLITTTEDNALWKEAKAKGMHCLSLPEKVGGRYSVFSAVGLFPLGLAGFDIGALHVGARIGRDLALAEGESPAQRSAIAQYHHWQKGAFIHNTFIFIPRLESVGKWYRQLMGESIGKRHNREGKEVFTGITPIVSIGSTDLHSMAQLFLGGPRDKFTTFLYQKSGMLPVTIPVDSPIDTVRGLSGRTFDQVLKAIYGGALKAYQKNTLPFVEFVFDRIDEESIAAFLQIKMIEMMYLAELMDVNAFDQPSVEDYKSETRKLLGE